LAALLDLCLVPLDGGGWARDWREDLAGPSTYITN